jgi:hypothetical protein
MMKPMFAFVVFALASNAALDLARADEPVVIALRYDAQLKAIGFPSPILTVTLDGQEAHFFIDSGAGVHTFAEWYVKAAGLSAKSDHNMKAVDSAGHKIDVAVLRDVRITPAAGDAFTISEAVVADFPPLFEENRIAGLLSPQLLASTTQAAVVDLNTPELRLEPMQAAVDRLNATVLSLGGATSLCTQPGSPLVNRLYAIRTIIDGVEASLTIDTGASSTTIREGTPAARGLRSKPGTGRDEMGIGGKRIRVFQSAPVDLDFGAGARRIAVGVGANAGGCSSEGLLGMDALRGCRWIFARAGIAMSCVKAPS